MLPKALCTRSGGSIYPMRSHAATTAVTARGRRNIDAAFWRSARVLPSPKMSDFRAAPEGANGEPPAPAATWRRAIYAERTKQASQFEHRTPPPIFSNKSGLAILRSGAAFAHQCIRRPEKGIRIAEGDFPLRPSGNTFWRLFQSSPGAALLHGLGPHCQTVCRTALLLTPLPTRFRRASC